MGVPGGQVLWGRKDERGGAGTIHALGMGQPGKKMPERPKRSLIHYGEGVDFTIHETPMVWGQTSRRCSGKGLMLKPLGAKRSTASAKKRKYLCLGGGGGLKRG